jgi:hypothetical protein
LEAVAVSGEVASEAEALAEASEAEALAEAVLPGAGKLLPYFI